MSEDLIPWVEKHRPREIDDIIQQDFVKKQFKKIIEKGNMPHLMLHGPPGTGKTSSVIALMLELFGPEKIEERVLELNASDERGIGVVRNKIIHFAKLAIGTPDERYPSPPFKIIVLDEADAMTNEAQSALRKVMESTTNITRFIFMCNYDHQIIDSIKSRCSVSRFNEINTDNCIIKLTEVSNYEKLPITKEAIDTIADICQGDIRRGINILHNLKYKKTDVIEKETVYEITSYVDEKEIEPLWKAALTNSISKIYKDTHTFANNGFPIYYVLRSLNRIITASNDLTDMQKAHMFICLSQCERRILSGSNELVQLCMFFVYLNGLVKHKIDDKIITF
jgi:replication factor C subunit 2/4